MEEVWHCFLYPLLEKKRERLTIKFLYINFTRGTNNATKWNEKQKMICRKNVTSIPKWCWVFLSLPIRVVCSNGQWCIQIDFDALCKFNIATIKTAARNFSHWRANKRESFAESIAPVWMGTFTNKNAAAKT